MVRLFLKTMPSLVNVCDYYGWSPAHYALNVNSWKLLVILLNVREPLTDATVCDLDEACKREMEQGGRTSRFVAKQIQQQMEGIRVSWRFYYAIIIIGLSSISFYSFDENDTVESRKSDQSASSHLFHR